MSIAHYAGAFTVLIIITIIGVFSGKSVKSAVDFNSGGRNAGAEIVMGSIVGTLVGGASTIGTSQLAFNYGFSAWWFTLGGGLGSLALAVFSKSLHGSGATTMPQILAREFGQKTSTAATLLTSMGSFLSIVSQFLSGIILITTVSYLGAFSATAAVLLLMLVYVIFGGVWGAGYVGIAKTILLYLSVGVCGLMALHMQGGIASFMAILPAERYFNLFARGVVLDLGSGISLILGMLTTQAYIQAVISARTLRLSRIGVLASAVAIPIVGIGGILVGMYMRIHHPEINPGSALPQFILQYVPPLAGGGVMAALLVAVVGTGAGVSLGLGSMIYNDIYRVYINKNSDEASGLLVTRLSIVMILLCAAIFSSGNLGTLILEWSFLSMGLRGAVAFGPLCAALFLKGRIPGRFALASMIAGPAVVLILTISPMLNIDPFLAGVAANLSVLGAGFIVKAAKG